MRVGGSTPEVSSQTVDIDYTITRDFLVYEDIFRQQSPFFEAALGRDFKEAHDRVVKLPEHTPEAFEIYLRWVYSSRIVVPNEADDNESEASKAMVSLLCRSYVLGDILQDVDFKDALVDAFIQKTSSSGYLPTEEAKYVYGNTIEGAPLHRVFATLSAEECVGFTEGNKSTIYGDFVWGKNEQQYSTVEFLCDVMKLVERRLNPGAFPGSDENHGVKWDEKTCRYHEHKEGICYKARIGVREV